MTVSSLMPCTGRAGIFKAHRVAVWYCNMQCGLSSKGGGGFVLISVGCSNKVCEPCH